MIDTAPERVANLPETIDRIIKTAPELQRLTNLLPPSVADALIFVVPKTLQYKGLLARNPNASLESMVQSPAILIYLETAMDLQNDNSVSMARNRLLDRGNQKQSAPVGEMIFQALDLLESEPATIYLNLRASESTLIDLIVRHHLISTTIGEALEDLNSPSHKQYAFPLLRDLQSVRNACEVMTESKMISLEEANKLTKQALVSN